MMEMTRKNIVAYARNFLGTPFCHQGRSCKAVDCVGVLVMLANESGYDVEDNRRYSRYPDGSLGATLDKYLEPIPQSKIKPGDILLFKISVTPQHVGIVGNYRHGGLSVIHAHTGVGKLVEHRLNETWWKRLVTAYKVPNIPDWNSEKDMLTI